MTVKSRVFSAGCAAIAVYILAAWTAYRFRHPSQTETELFLSFLEAMLWR